MQCLQHIVVNQTLCVSLSNKWELDLHIEISEMDKWPAEQEWDCDYWRNDISSAETPVSG